MKALLAVLAVLIVLSISEGCQVRAARQPAESGIEEQVAMPNGYDVLVFRLQDGTRCVTFGHTGITCDWTGARDTR